MVKGKAYLRRLMAMILALLTAASISSACFAEGSPAHVEGAIFGGRNDDSIAVEVDFDISCITGGCSTEYSRELAAVSALICADTYFREKDIDKGTQNRLLFDGIPAEEYDRTLMLRELGFTDVRYIESFKEREYPADGNDSVTLVIGYQEADGCDVFAAAFRGVFSAAEWYSFFDVGCDVETYENCSGSHPEWANRNNAKGVDIAVNRALEIIRGYVSEHDDPLRENRILVTGHSRGGSIACAVGAAFEDDPDFTSFTYTFDAGCFTSDSDAGRYETVFNIFDADDFFSGPVFGDGLFCRYGRDMSLSVGGTDEVRGALAGLKGRDDFTGSGTLDLETYAGLFSDRFPSRESFYVPCTLTETFDTKGEAQARLDELASLIDGKSGLGLETFCSLGEVCAEDGQFSVTMNYCGGALLIAYGRILAYGAPAHEGTVSLFREDNEGCKIADYISGHSDDISRGHLIASCYVLTDFLP